jgi:hypothetical protein
MNNSLFGGKWNDSQRMPAMAQRETCLHFRGLPYWMPPHGEFFPETSRPASSQHLGPCMGVRGLL